MAFVVKHVETGKFIARKGVQKGVKFRLTDDIMSAQLFNTKNSVSTTIGIMHEDFSKWRRWRENLTRPTDYYEGLPESDDFAVYRVMDIVIEPEDE